MKRRSDDHIRELCNRILRTTDEDQVVQFCIELRKAIQGHVEQTRSRAAQYPVTRERRKLTEKHKPY